MGYCSFYTETLVLGATFFGISYALSHADTSMVVERTGLVGSEFVDSFNERSPKKVKLSFKEGVSFKNLLAEKEAINANDEIYAAAAMFTMCSLMKKKAVNIMFLTEVLEIVKESDGYKIKIFNIDGYSYIFAKNIIDTTSHGILHDSIADFEAKKYLNAIIHSETGNEIPENFNAVTNGLTNKTVLWFEVGVNTGWFEAREKLHRFIQQNIPNSGWKVSLISNTFAYLLPHINYKIAENYYWHPSSGYQSLLEAFDKGGNFNV